MTILSPLTPQEYTVLKQMLREMETIEADYRERSGRRGFEDADAQPLREFDDLMATMRAAVEGYEAANPQHP